jgi:hypothetical protein
MIKGSKCVLLNLRQGQRDFHCLGQFEQFGDSEPVLPHQLDR